MRVLTLLTLAAVAAAGPIEDAREKLRKGNVDLAATAVEALVAADSAEAVKALHQGVETVLARSDREMTDYLKKTEDWIRLQTKVIEVSSEILDLIRAGRTESAEFKALKKKQEDLSAKGKGLAADQKAAGARVASSETIAVGALAAFRRFRSEAAIGVLEGLAAGKAGRVSRACTGAIACIGAPSSQAVLAKLSRSKDVDQRILAVRGLRGPEGAAPPDLAACLAEKSWQVRLAAYEGAARASPPVAIPLLIEARSAARPDEQPRIDFYLRRLTGVALADSAQWKTWWTENGDAVRGGTFKRSADGTPAPAEPVAAAQASGRLSVLVSAEAERQRERDRTGKPIEEPERANAVRDAAKPAIEGIAEGATFNLILAGEDPKPPGRSSDSSRRSATERLEELKDRPLGTLFRSLIRLIFHESGHLQHVDTVLVIAAASEKFDPEEVDVLVSRLGELPTIQAFHCVGAGDSCDDYLLASLALQTGGACAAGDTRVYAKVPAPGADTWTAGNVRVAAYRRLRRGVEVREALKSLAPIGEEAYPLLPMVMARLESSEPDDVRTEALLVLGAMGEWAREALPRIQALAADGSGDLGKAAQAALDRIAAK